MGKKRNKRKTIGLGPFILILLLLVVVGVASVFLIQDKTEIINETNKKLDAQEDKNEELELHLEDIEDHKNDMEQQIEDLKIQLEELRISKAKGMPGGRVAYLTFDDGPSDNTMDILDVLKEFDVKGTFFVIGNPNRTDVYKRIVGEGHTIGNHTYSHDYNSIYRSPDAFFSDVEKLNDLIEESTGVRSKILRFPGGSNNTISVRAGGKEIMDKMIKEANKEGYMFYDWNVDSLDASKVKQNKDIIVNSVINGAKHSKRAMILMHDAPVKTTTVEALPEIINGLLNKGFVFKRIEEDTKQVRF